MYLPSKQEMNNTKRYAGKNNIFLGEKFILDVLSGPPPTPQQADMREGESS